MQTRPFSPDIIFTSIPALLPYLAVTLVVGVTSILTGSILGMLLAWAKLSGHKVIRALADGYTYIIRCTPSIVLLFIVFYGLPKFMEAEFGIDMDNLSLPSLRTTRPFRISTGGRGTGRPASTSGHTGTTSFPCRKARTFSFLLFPPLYLQFLPRRQALTRTLMMSPFA